jgi:hypothetical protein
VEASLESINPLKRAVTLAEKIQITYINEEQKEQLAEIGQTAAYV